MCTKVYWIWAFKSFPAYPGSTLRSGKWMMFPGKEDVDTAWKCVSHLLEIGKLGCGAKVAPASRARGQHLICVYTRDWDDEDDVMRVLLELRDSGLPCADRRLLNYKTDDATHAGLYSADDAARAAGFAGGAAAKRHKSEKVGPLSNAARRPTLFSFAHYHSTLPLIIPVR